MVFNPVLRDIPPSRLNYCVGSLEWRISTGSDMGFPLTDLEFKVKRLNINKRQDGIIESIKKILSSVSALVYHKLNSDF